MLNIFCGNPFVTLLASTHCVSCTSSAWKKWTILLLQINHNLFCDSVVVERENHGLLLFHPVIQGMDRRV